MKLWIDDVRPAPEGWVWIRTTDEAIAFIIMNKPSVDPIEIISLDYDCGDFLFEGGNYINILEEMEWMSENGSKDFSHTQFHLHSESPVGVQKMRRIIQRNGWKEVK